MNQLVFFVGSAGAGKTTLARAVAARRPAVIFDMDTLLRPAAAALMAAHGLDPSDRDSAAYKKLCRDLGYRITMDAALDNLGLGADLFVIGPFTQETADPGWLAGELARAGRSLSEVTVKVVVVGLADEQLYRERIAGRKLALDDWKLAHWDEFRRSLAPRAIAWPLAEANIRFVDNSPADPVAAVQAVDEFIDAGTKINP